MIEKIPGIKTSRGATIIALGTLAIFSLVLAIIHYFTNTDETADLLTQALAVLGLILTVLTVAIYIRRSSD